MRDGELILRIEKKASQGFLAFLKDDRVRISELTHDETFKGLFGLLMVKIATLSGIKGKITDLDKEDIYKIILSSFKELSFDEIYKAFELDRSGVYSSEIKPYGLFNAKYVSQILLEYKKWKSKMRHEHKMGLEKPKEEEITEEMNMKALEDGVIRLFLNFGKHKIIPIGNNHIYNFLKKKGNIKHAEGAERERIIKKAKHTLALENDFSKGVRKAVISESSLVSECKRIQLEEYFENEYNKQENELNRSNS